MSNSGAKIVRGSTIPDNPKEEILQKYTKGAKHVTLVDENGDVQTFKLVGLEDDELKINSDDVIYTLGKVIKELKIMNIHLALITDSNIDREDVQ